MGLALGTLEWYVFGYHEVPLRGALASLQLPEFLSHLNGVRETHLPVQFPGIRERPENLSVITQRSLMTLVTTSCRHIELGELRRSILFQFA